MSNMQPGHQVKQVTPGIAIGSMLPGARDLMDQALEEWEKMKLETRMSFPDFATDGEIHAFAYWLFRWSGLIQYNTEE